ncbi:hypothetical protein [Lentzea aerocolonigenes]|uniref:hypothetical protein n=1 Tax=Lentzea aerocolonigenes TaxID=68170 RepID=UPI0004C3BC62|nr:hypothetical protein [Lentzea aerocolonigenes]MCP2244726.1 hypothetical protein [Lentzea aerocolonigenes]
MDLDDELRRLFSDDRLDVHSTPDATEAVVRGAERRRRRRSATTTAFALVVLVGAGAALTQLPRSDDTAGDLLPTSTSSASATTTTTAVSTFTSTAIVTVDPPPNSNSSSSVKTETGQPTNKTTIPAIPAPPQPQAQPGQFGSLKLGMSEADALATGSLIEPSSAADPENRCKAYATKSVPDANAVIISPVRGIVRITVPGYAKTPKGITVGSTVDQVKAAYPNATQSGSTLFAKMAATPAWSYVFETDGSSVTAVLMRLDANDCSAV